MNDLKTVREVEEDAHALFYSSLASSSLSLPPLLTYRYLLSSGELRNDDDCCRLPLNYRFSVRQLAHVILSDN